MLAVYRAILLFVHLLHFKSTHVLASDNITTIVETTTARSVKLVPQDAALLDIGDAAITPMVIAATLAPLSKANATNQYDDSLTSAQTEDVKARILATSTTEGTPIGSNKHRTGRQLFLDPGIFLLQQGIGWEGAQCLSSGGMFGVCVRIDSCRQYYRVTRQITFFAVRQWSQPAANGVCSFYDQLGRANSGICCTDVQSNGFSVFPQVPPALAPTVGTEPPMQSIDNTEVVNSGDEREEDSPDFQDINVEVDKSQETNMNVSNQVVPVVYDDTTRFQYQWPPSFGHFAGLPQWPPAIPTHPPSTGGWPPPLPTHPPGHHYPTHPPAVAAGIRPTTTSPTSTQTTKATSSQRPTISTTRRPSYPGYPTYRPITTTTIATTTTTRRPISNDGASGTSPEGLPLRCGARHRQSPDQERIVGGINASPHEFPWIAVLFKSGKQFCGGSLITNSHVLTAAHCVARMTSWDVAALTAHLGDYNIRTDFEVKHVERRIKRLVRHKGFDFSTLHNDVAILTLSEPVPYTAEIQPICLPTSASQQSRSYSGQLATVAGWGSLRENGPQPSILQKVDIPIWANQECARKYGRAAPGGIIESMICAGQAAKDSCSGDSGGPMIVQDGGRYTQVGIVSWGIGCGKGQYPGVYTRVTSLLSWIYKNIK